MVDRDFGRVWKEVVTDGFFLENINAVKKGAMQSHGGVSLGFQIAAGGRGRYTKPTSNSGCFRRMD
jgi:hypothetical protein